MNKRSSEKPLVLIPGKPIQTSEVLNLVLIPGKPIQTSEVLNCKTKLSFKQPSCSNLVQQFYERLLEKTSAQNILFMCH